MLRLSRSFVLASLLLAAACGDDGDDGDPSSPSTLVSVDKLAAGAECAAGGVAIRTGADANRNGKLDAAEVTQTQYVCDGAAGGKGDAGQPGGKGDTGQPGGEGETGADGVSTLATVDVEPVGTHCESGGLVVRTGRDLDRDGVLDASEADPPRYVCHGAAGAANPLIRLVPEPAGAHCATGGTAILVGGDDDGDGALADIEVDGTEYLCREPAPRSPEIVIGHVLVFNSLDVDRLAGVREVTGNVVVDVPGLPALDLTSLTRVGGSLEVRGTLAPRIALPNLVSVGGGLSIVGNEEATALDLAELVSVGGGVHLGDNGKLAAMAAGKLATIEGGLTVTGADTLPIAFPALTSIRGFVTLADGAVSATSFAALATVGRGIYFDVRNLRGTLALPALTLDEVPLRVTDSDLASLSVGQPGTTRLQVTRSHVGTLDLALITAARGVALDHARIERLDLSSLAQVGMDGIEIADSQVEAIDLRRLATSPRAIALSSSRLGGLSLPALTRVESLSMRGVTGVASLAFPALTAVDFSLTIEDTPIAGGAIALPALVTTADSHSVPSVVITGNGAGEVSLPGVSWVGNLTIDEPAATTLRLDALELAGDVRIAGVRVQALALPELRSANQLVLAGTGVVSVTAPELSRVDRLQLGGNAALTTLDLALETAREITIEHNGELTSLASLDDLQIVETLRVIDNDRLTTLGLPFLYRIGDDLVIRDNGALASCHVDAFVARFVGDHAPDDVDVGGNDDSGVCGP